MTTRDNAKPLRPQRPKPVAESVSRSDGEADKRRNKLKRFFDAVMSPGLRLKSSRSFFDLPPRMHIPDAPHPLRIEIKKLRHRLRQLSPTPNTKDET